MKTKRTFLQTCMPSTMALRRVFLTLLAVGVLGSEASAQFTGNNQTNTISGVTSNWTGNYYVGPNYVFDALLIQNSGVLSNSGVGYIGFLVGANSNSVTVSGSGSVWKSSSVLVVGNYGADNSLVISNGGMVFNGGGNGHVGVNSSASNNRALVTGLGSVWINTGAQWVGDGGTSNSMIISSGGAVFSTSGHVGGSLGGRNNSALVTGGGSVWKIQANSGQVGLYVGENGAGNSLTVSNGGAVFDGTGFVGYTGVGISNNSVLVTGSGSIWSNRFEAFVGFDGDNNTLTITNGGSVVASNAYVGYVSGADGNRINISGGSLRVTNAVGNGNLEIGSSGAGNSVMISDGGVVFNDRSYVGNNSSASNNSVLVTGSGSVWSNTLDLAVGYIGAGNSLLITNGGSVFSFSGGIGRDFTVASNNSVVVTGNGSVWSNAYQLAIGRAARNSLVISDGGKVFSSGGFVGSSFNTGNDNRVLVTGSGSEWSSKDWNNMNLSGEVQIGGSGARNSMVISNGGAVVSWGGEIGGGSVANSNSVLVSGSGSVWSNNNVLTIGNFGSGNSLVISNGGTVFTHSPIVPVNGGGLIGNDASTRNNTVLVTGSGSCWNMLDATLRVGWNGSSNTLTIADGGAVLCGYYAYVGYGSSAVSNRIIVSGGSLCVTNAAGTGVLDLQRGALIFNNGTITADKLLLTNASSSVVAFNGGTLNSKGTAVTNAQQLVVGDGAASANFHLLGGVHSFNNGLRIRSNSFLTGCGTITGTVVVDAGGSVVADCGGYLTFTGIVTNNGTVQITNGSTLETYSTFVNNGAIQIINGFTNFHGAFINNGTVTSGSSPVISSIALAGADVTVQIFSFISSSYQLQISPTLSPTNWANSGASQAGNGGVLSFTDPGGATNSQRHYRVKVTQ